MRDAPQFHGSCAVVGSVLRLCFNIGFLILLFNAVNHCYIQWYINVTDTINDKINVFAQIVGKRARGHLLSWTKS